MIDALKQIQEMAKELAKEQDKIISDIQDSDLLNPIQKKFLSEKIQEAKEGKLSMKEAAKMMEDFKKGDLII